MLSVILLPKQKILLINQILDNSEDSFSQEMKIEEEVTNLEVEEIIIKSSRQKINLKKKIRGRLNHLKKIPGANKIKNQIKNLKKMHGFNQILKMKTATGTHKWEKRDKEMNKIPLNKQNGKLTQNLMEMDGDF